MLEITYSQYELETFFLILIRITSFIYIAPFFGQTNTPQRIKLGLALFLSFIVYTILPDQTFTYDNNLEYAVLILKEAVTGILIGYSAYMCGMIVVFAGYFMDLEMGLTMAQNFDPQTKTQLSVSGVLYRQLFLLISLATDAHWFLLSATVDSFTVIPLGGMQPKVSLIGTLIDFIGEYFILGFRIALPILASSLIVNIILGIMTKIAPQLHMFSIGVQIKVLAGLLVLFMTISALPNITSVLSDLTKEVLIDVMRDISP